MGQRLLVINGHPDPRPERLCAALANAYGEGAASTGRLVRRLDLGSMEFPIIRSEAEFEDGAVPPSIAEAQDAIRWADHLLIVHPLWLGGPPALLKGFLEQAFRYGFATPRPGEGSPLGGLLKGRTARVVVTMGMPALAYRWMFGAFGARALERGVLWLSGFRGLRRTLLGSVGAASAQTRGGWLERMRRLGARGD